MAQVADTGPSGGSDAHFPFHFPLWVIPARLAIPSTGLRSQCSDGGPLVEIDRFKITISNPSDAAASKLRVICDEREPVGAAIVDVRHGSHTPLAAGSPARLTSELLGQVLRARRVHAASGPLAQSTSTNDIRSFQDTHTLSTTPETTFSVVLALSIVSGLLLLLLLGTWCAIFVRYKSALSAREDTMNVQITKHVDVEKTRSPSHSGSSAFVIVPSIGTSSSQDTLAASSNDDSELSVPLSLLDRMHRLPSFPPLRTQLVDGPYVGPSPAIAPPVDSIALAAPIARSPSTVAMQELTTEVRPSEARGAFDPHAYDDVYATVTAMFDLLNRTS